MQIIHVQELIPGLVQLGEWGNQAVIIYDDQGR